MTTRDYMTMCSNVMDFYTSHKTMINSVDGLEGYFSNLHILVINLQNHQKRLKTQITPLLKEKESQAEALETLFDKFNQALEQVSIAKAKKAGRKKDVNLHHKHHHVPEEIIDQYLHISERARAVHKDLREIGIGKQELQELDTLATQYIIAVPVINLLNEKKDYAGHVAKKMMAEIDYLMTHQIDPHMAFFTKVDTSLYRNYQVCRQLSTHANANGGKRVA